MYLRLCLCVCVCIIMRVNEFVMYLFDISYLCYEYESICDVTVIIENGHSNPCSNPGPGCLHFA